MTARLITFLIAICGWLISVAQDFHGDWSGRLSVGNGVELRLVLHVDRATDAVTLDSPDQSAYGLACTTDYLGADSISVSIPDLMMAYSGHLDGDIIKGTFSQGPLRSPLQFCSGYEKPNRPQTPVPPFPYSAEELQIPGDAPGVTLAGTLTVPEVASESTPMVVMVSGSGLQNRDEELMGHKPFAVIADWLARNGIASFRYDDRGYGESTGDASNATTPDFAADTRSVTDWFRRQGKFGKIGVLGHSEGGMIAYMLGGKDGGADFIISIAGPSVKGSKILDYQNEWVLMKAGFSEEQAEQKAKEARANLEAGAANPWLKYFLQYDPAADIRAIAVPALIIYGEKDSQVPASLNFVLAQFLAPKAVVMNYPGLNHLMQHCETGDVAEYGAIEETISPQVLADMVTFIKRQ